jgi:hypothetical protein
MLLADPRVNPSQPTQDGRTPLHVAAENGYTKVVQALLNKGADPNQATRDGVTPLDVAINGVLTHSERDAGIVAQIAERGGGCGEGAWRGLFDVPTSPEGDHVHRLSASLLRALAFANRLSALKADEFERAQQVNSETGADHLARAFDAFAAIRTQDAPAPSRAAMRDLCRNGGLADASAMLLANPGACRGLMQMAEASPPGTCGNNPAYEAAYEAFRLLNTLPSIAAMADGRLYDALQAGRQSLAAEHLCESVGKRITDLNGAAQASAYSPAPVVFLGNEVEYMGRIAAEVNQRVPDIVSGALSASAMVPYADWLNNACSRHDHEAFCQRMTQEFSARARSADLNEVREFLQTHPRVGGLWQEAVLSHADGLFLPAGMTRQQALQAEEPPQIPSVIVDSLADPGERWKDCWKDYEEGRLQLKSGEATVLGDGVMARRKELRKALVADLGPALSGRASLDGKDAHTLVSAALERLAATVRAEPGEPAAKRQRVVSPIAASSRGR